MPDVQEVFRMATQKVRQDPGAQDRQIRRRRRAARNRRFAAVAVVIVLIGGAAAAFALARNGTDVTPASFPSTSLGPPVPGESGTMVDLVTQRVTPLPASISSMAAAYYAWSPDYTKIAFSSCCTADDPLYVANVDGTGIRSLTPTGQSAYGAQWSPDGSELLYQRRNGDSLSLGGLFIVDVATGQQARLTNFDQSKEWDWWFTFPSFRPDGRSILYQLPTIKRGNLTWDLWTVPVTGGRPTLATHNGGWGGLAYGKASARHDYAYLAPMNATDLSGEGLWVASWGLRSVKPREMVGGGHLSWLRWSRMARGSPTPIADRSTC